MDAWYEYRLVWSRHPWVAAVFALAIACVVAGIIGTFLANLLAIVFVPGLLLAYGHHLIVTRKYG